jgi:hypothetical protein
MDGLKFFMRVSQKLAEQAGVGEVLFEGGRTNPAKHGQLSQQIVYRLVVIHIVQRLKATALIMISKPSAWAMMLKYNFSWKRTRTVPDNTPHHIACGRGKKK